MDEKVIIINKFFAGIMRDEKARIPGAASNIEEIDIFSNADYFQAEQVFSADSLPAGTEIYAKTANTSDVVYGYGKETSGNKVRLVSVAGGGTDDPGSFSTLFTSADTTDLAYSVSPCQFFKTTESNTDYIYYCTKAADNTVKLKRYDITGEDEENVGTLSQLTGSYDRIAMRVMFGELFITNGKYITKIDKDGVFYEDAFTLPNGYIAVDLTPVSDVAVILARDINRLANDSKGFWWDLTSALQVDDSFQIPFGGPQWIFNHKETIKFLCAQNGKARLYQLSGAFPGAIPIELPGILIDNIATETATQPVSAPKMVGTKDNILYFGLYKTDKTGIYGLGQLDSDKPTALVLSKRFSTSDYSAHRPTSLFIQGPNFYADYVNNGTAASVRCESKNSPNRSTQAVYESIWIDDGDATSNKDLKGVYITTKPLPANTDVDAFVAGDYGAYLEVLRPNGTSLNTTNALMGYFKTGQANKKVYKVKIGLTSSGTNTPIVTSIGLVMNIKNNPSFK